MNKAIIGLILMTGWVSAANAQSLLKVHLTSGEPLTVAVDGRYFNKRGTSVTVGDLPAGRHFVQIYGMRRTWGGRMREDIIYEGRVRTSEGMITLLQYDPVNRITNTQMDLATSYNAGQPAMQEQQGLISNNDNNQPTQQQEQEIADNNDNGPVASPVPVGTLTQEKIDQLKKEVDSKKTDTDKMNALKNALNKETYNSVQVATMMEWFSFEGSKVEFAEWAWNDMVDRENFQSLEVGLKYKNYQDDMEKFLKTKQ
jgi:hypothetical protein